MNNTIKEQVSKHTPGPWHVSGRNIWSEMRSLALIRKSCYADKSVNEADARLIAAAPELLEACRQVRTMLESMQRTPEVRQTWAQQTFIESVSESFRSLDSAIQKAEGL